jgi:Domain of unknown function (DUF4349)
VSPETNTIDERFDELVAALRAEIPATPASLQDRVAEVTAARPAQPRFTARRILVFAAPAVAGLSLAVAVAVGLNSAIDDSEAPLQSAGRASQTESEPRERAPQAEPESTAPLFRAGVPQSAPDARRQSATPAPGGRAVDYHATLTLLVDGTEDLSATTQRALRTARGLGGHLVSVAYSTPEPGEGTAAVRLRIPVSRVQAAIVQFSSFGQILAQDTRIADLQQPLDELTRRIRRLERQAARATGPERARIEAQIAALRRQRVEINRRAAFATVNLDLTTHEPKEPAATPSRIDRALGDAVGILLVELVIAAYVLIVASPLLVLLAAGFFGNRAYRRHADQRLLERA